MKTKHKLFSNQNESKNADSVPLGTKVELYWSKIVWLQADINYTKIHTSDGKDILIAYHLGLLEKRLAGTNSFVRPNRGTLINLKYVSAITEDHIMVRKKRFAYSRRRKESTLAIIKSSKCPKN